MLFDFSISARNPDRDDAIWQRINLKTKPPGALGQLESLAAQLASLWHTDTPQVSAPHLFVYAGDHGVAAEGVSIAPSEVTAQMVANFAAGGAAINVFSRQTGWTLQVVDAGILVKPAANADVINARLGDITQPIHKAPALTEAQLAQAFTYAREHMASAHAAGANLVAFGEMGIGNTTPAAAIMSALLNLPATQTVGKGTGVSDDIILRKQAIVTQALELHAEYLSQPLEVLRRLGGFEIAQICAAILAAAEKGMAVVIDGFICSAAALIATKLYPASRDYMIFAHCSGEQGHQQMLKELDATPLLQLGMRLGEGTGAALSLPLIEAACNFYNQMASFADAAVTDVSGHAD